MKLIFSTAGRPIEDLAAALGSARELGFDSAEVECRDPRRLANPSAALAASVTSGVAISCITTPVTFSRDRAADLRAADEIRGLILAAERVGATLVQIGGPAPRRAGGLFGRLRDDSASAVALEAGNWMLPLADIAATHGVSIAVRNSGAFQKTAAMWLLLDRLEHPAIGCGLDTLDAVLAGESAALCVPTLNSKVLTVAARDATIGPDSAVLCEPGLGNVGVERFISRLHGIGFAGPVAFTAVGGAGKDAADSAARLRRWVAPREPLGAGKGRPHVALGGKTA